MSAAESRTDVHPGELAQALTFTRALFRTPDAEQWRRLHTPGVRETFVEIETWAGARSGDDAAAAGAPLSLPRSARIYETEFLQAFEVGAPHPPVPLIESHYNRRDPVPKILHENILFYGAFGLRLRASANETADHLRHQLEFAAYLCRLEERLLDETNGEERLAQVRRARAEYAERHLLSWLPKAAGAAARAPSSWIRRYLGIALAVARVTAGGAEEV